MPDQQKIDMYVMANSKYFPEEKIVFLREKLRTIDDEKFSLISFVSFKEPITVLIVSILFGYLGIDRFMIGDVGMGILKMFTLGLFGILTIYDWVTISKTVKEKNFNKIATMI